MIRHRFFVAVALATCALAVSAGDPWVDKPYTDWDQREVNKILQNSPWARTVFVPWESSIVPLTPGRGSRPHSFFVVQWASSLTVRQAVVRQAQLSGTPQAAQGNQDSTEFLTRPQENFVLLVWWVPGGAPGQPMTAPAQWTDLAYIQGGKSGKEIAPVKVQALNEQIVQLEFPRTVQGKEWLTPEERKVHFEYRLDLLLRLPPPAPRKMEVPVIVDFDLGKMIREGKPDL